MKKRKLIGVIISEVEGIYQNKLLKGIISECYALDYDVAVFSTLIKDTGLPEYQVGEKNIFNLINFELFDGIIVAGITLAIKDLPQEVEQMILKKCRCPILFVDMSSKYFPSVYTNDRKPMEQMTDHLIEVHGYRNILCLAGEKSNISTISRVAGFKDSFLKHGIPLDEKKILYDGDFNYTSGEQFARRLVEGELEWPEAVVCISDYMAIGLANELIKHGILVPEEIAITGYDATDEAVICQTMITSYSPPVKQTGVEAVDELTRLMTGELPERHNTYPGKLEIGHSCGCKDIDYMKRSGMVRLRGKMEDYKILLDSYMSEALYSVMDMEDCVKQLCEYLYLIKDYSDFYLCLCENWDGSADNYSIDTKEFLKTEYSDRMILALAARKKQCEIINKVFDTKDMLPDLWEERDKPQAYYFTPMHFRQCCIGYSVLTYGSKVQAFDIIYRNWCRIVMNALEFNRSHRKLYRSSFRDVLTGIFNRNGFEQNQQRTVNEANVLGQKVFVLMADLDNLKTVNDQYGHLEGDNIISVVAKVFQSNCKTHDVCARIGGDEFLVIGIDGEGEDSMDSYVMSVTQDIDIYNNTSKKPYKIEISIGAVSNYVDDLKKIKTMTDQADQIMYFHKAINKKERLERIRALEEKSGADV